VIPDIGKDPDTNVGADSQRSRPKVASLFASVMGAGRSSKASKADSEPQAPQVASPTAEKGMRLGAVNAEERLPSSQPEDDLLDIPTFLRRQAN
jgi:cell division protein FtsZ